MSIWNKPLTVCTQILFKRSIMTASSRCQKVVEELKGNPYYEKYASKIATLQETSPEEFLSRVEKHEEEKAKSSKFGSVKERQFSSVLEPKKSSANITLPKKSLNDYMKLELVVDKSAEEIKELWQQYHKDKDVISGTIPIDLYDKIEERSKEHKIFLLPLPRSQGYEFFMLQFDYNEVHFTPLICYQVHKENAPECLTIWHYTELKDKGLILMRGEFDKNVLDAKEAQCLANQLQMYYGQNHESKQKLLEVFTKSPQSFKHTDLINELENLTLT